VHVACFYVFLATLLELGQNFAPGREAEALTALVSMSGAVVGEIVARVVTGVWREKYGWGMAQKVRVPTPIDLQRA
jgi:VanZ family protein